MVPTQLNNETIVAIITPPGEGGIAAIRLAGPDCKKIIKKHFKTFSKKGLNPFMLRYG